MKLIKRQEPAGASLASGGADEYPDGTIDRYGPHWELGPACGVCPACTESWTDYPADWVAKQDPTAMITVEDYAELPQTIKDADLRHWVDWAEICIEQGWRLYDVPNDYPTRQIVRAARYARE